MMRILESETDWCALKADFDCGSVQEPLSYPVAAIVQDGIVTGFAVEQWNFSLPATPNHAPDHS